MLASENQPYVGSLDENVGYDIPYVRYPKPPPLIPDCNHTDFRSRAPVPNRGSDIQASNKGANSMSKPTTRKVQTPQASQQSG